LREQQLQQQQLQQQQLAQQQASRVQQCQRQCYSNYNNCMSSAATAYVDPRTGKPDPFAGAECPGQKAMCEVSCR
jgi:hypothetical protein